MLRASIDILMERDALRNGKNIVGDKSPSSLFDGDSIRMAWCLYPDAHVIAILRDGRDTIVSHLLQTYMDSEHVLKWREKRIRNSFRRNPFPFYEGKRSLFTSNDLRNRAEGWVRNVLETERVGRELFGNRYLQIKYEDLLSRPKELMDTTWNFLGAQPAAPGLVDEIEREVQYNPDAPRQLELLPALEHSKYKGGPGIWRELMTVQDRNVVKEIAGQTLIDYGYEKDLEW
jgi:hypothetical protein